MKKKRLVRERIIRNKDIEALGLKSVDMQVNMCKRTPARCMYAWAEERKDYGFDQRETWNFNQTLFEFLYTRLKMFDRVNILDMEMTVVTCRTYGKEENEYHMTLQSYLNRLLTDLETMLKNTDDYPFENEAESIYLQTGRRVLMALSECFSDLCW